MNSTTFAPLFAATTAADAPVDQPTGKSPLWTRLFAQLVEARQAQANAIVARHMALQDDATLKSLNWSDAEIADLRRRLTPAGR